jgi:UDPglucose--hexose-1-phosphate uridylyltransferase
MTMNLFSNPHRRYNPLTNEWILVSPHRTQRPWLGQIEKIPTESRPAYDPNCYLCPGNERAGGKRNPQYENTFVFDNDFAALLPVLPPPSQTVEDPRSEAEGRESWGGGILRAESERGVCRVICFSPRHDWTLPDLPLPDIRHVVDVWVEQTRELGALDFVNYVQVFENKGAAMGASNPHPHCQVWANEHVPTEPAKELRSLSAYRDEHDACLLCDYLALELAQRERIVLQNDHFVALVPFWAVWPFETMVLARRHIGALSDLNDAERDALADIVKRLTTRYDNLFEISFPYSMGWHQSPTDNVVHPETHLHAHYYPPLLRSATVRKFMVGYEMLANPQRDLTAETAAARLREMSDSKTVRQ